MGMSASQARFLCLTARKSNIEFEGQQINQQRTSLSNTSGAYYSELCNMVVPTPPSIDDFTKVTYSFNDGALTNTITSMIAQKNGQYTISYVQQWQDDYSIVSAASSAVARTNTTETPDVKYFYVDPETDDAQELTISIDKNGKTTYMNQRGQYLDYDKYGKDIYALIYNKDADNAEDATTFVSVDKDGNIVDEDGNPIIYTTTYAYSIGNDKLRKVGEYTEEQANADAYLKNLTKEERDEVMEQEKYYLTLLNEKNGTTNEQYYVRYIKDVATGSYVPYFYKASELNNEGEYTNNLATSVDCYTIGTATKTKEVLNQKGIVEKDSTGRYIGITLFDENDENKGIEYTLTVNTSTDQAAYDDAMNKYNYEQYQYDQKVQEINSKIEIIQQQDKSLELELKHLETEHSAIDAETEAVKKIISKNVDGSFKTFSA